MLVHLQDWLALALRWVHLIAGISWIGSSFYFIWLDSAIEAPETPKPGVEGELWMVHSGGFYQVEKRKIRPGEMPKVLHWFKWEAFFTWLSGIVLLAVVYYMTGGLYLLDANVSSISPTMASLLGVGLLLVSWVFYDLLWKSTIGTRYSATATGICFAALVAMTWGLCHTLSGRGAFIHVGAVFGTIMVLNVWMRILPAQSKMIEATREGRLPDYTLGMAAKRRSVHNSYMTFPVLFIMLSNHWPMTWSGPHNWIVLLLLIFVGAAFRHSMIAKTPRGHLAWIPAVFVLSAVIVMTAPATHGGAQSGLTAVSFLEARQVIAARCLECHSEKPTSTIFKVAPNGIVFDTPQRMKDLAARIRFRAVESKTMPLANTTGITESERALLGRWVDEGARIE